MITGYRNVQYCDPDALLSRRFYLPPTFSLAGIESRITRIVDKAVGRAELGEDYFAVTELPNLGVWKMDGRGL